MSQPSVSRSDESASSSSQTWETGQRRFQVLYDHQKGEQPMPPERSSLDRPPETTVTILVGERGSGRSSCLSWWGKNVEAAKGRIAELPLARLDLLREKKFDSSQIVKLLTLDGPERASGDNHGSTAEYVVLPVDIAVLSGTEQERLCVSLRTYAERAKTAGPVPCFILTSTRLDHFLDTLEVSGLLAVSHAVRVAGFQEETLRRLVSERFPALAGELQSRLCSGVMEATGGQAALTKAYLDQLGAAPARLNDRLLRRWLTDTEERVRLSPPRAQMAWCRELERIVVGNPELLKRMRVYLREGPLSDPAGKVHLAERALLVAGWVDQDVHKRWGLRSRLHQTWARDVLDRLPEAR